MMRVLFEILKVHLTNLRRSLDNVTSVMIAFQGFKKYAFPYKVNRSTEKIKLSNRSSSGKRELKKTSCSITKSGSKKKRNELLTKTKDQMTFISRMFPQSARDNRSTMEIRKPQLLKKIH